MNKKGQLTIFIILGIVLLVAVVLFLVFRTEITKVRPERVLPPEVENVQRFFTSCLDQQLKDGLMILGTQGGYIYMPPAISSNPDSYVNIGLKIPHWIYQGENRIPTLPIMEAHIERYLLEGVETCYVQLDQFREQVDITRKEPEVLVNIADAGVTADITFPIEVALKTGERITELDKFIVQSPVRLKQMFALATHFMEYQNDQKKVENLAMDLVALNDKTPLSGVTFSCSQNLWSASEVRNRVRNMISVNLPLVRISNGEYLAVPEDQPYLKNHLVWNVAENTYPGISATLSLGPGFDMNVRPSDGDIMKASVLQSSDIASFLCIQHFKFTYDMRFPVVANVEDIDNNFNLQFAFNVMVQRNKPLLEPLSQPVFNVATDYTTSEDYCSGYSPYTIQINTHDNVSDPEFGESTEPVNGINVTFTCLRYTCPLGISKYYDGGALAYVEADVPCCTSALIRASGPGYIERTGFLSTDHGVELDMYLTPIKELNYTVVKHVMKDDLILGARALDPDERAFVTLVYRVNNTEIHRTQGSYPREFETGPITLLGHVKVPYEVRMFIMKDNELIGGYEGIWEPDWEEFKYGNSVVFHAVAVEQGLSDQGFLRFIQGLASASKQIPAPEVIQ